MYLRRATLDEVEGRPMMQKALAFALYVKKLVGRSSMVLNCTVNRLHEMTRVSATTIKKLLPLMIQQGWVGYRGKNNEHLIINSLSSSNARRNLSLEEFSFDAYKSVYKSLRAFLVLLMQSRKEYIKRLLLTTTEPTDYHSFKVAKQKVKQLVRHGVLSSLHQKYKEYGLSYKRIARRIGCCLKTAIGVIKYAIDRDWVTKENHQSQFYSKNTNFDKVEGFTFTTKNNLYIIKANTYILQPSAIHSLAAWLS